MQDILPDFSGYYTQYRHETAIRLAAYALGLEIGVVKWRARLRRLCHAAG